MPIKGYANTYSVKILNDFNPELQLKDIENAIRNKLIDLLTELKGFKFMMTLVLEFKKIESDDKTIYNMFCLNSKSEKLLMKEILIMYFNHFVLRLYQT